MRENRTYGLTRGRSGSAASLYSTGKCPTLGILMLSAKTFSIVITGIPKKRALAIIRN